MSEHRDPSSSEGPLRGTRNAERFWEQFGRAGGGLRGGERGAAGKGNGAEAGAPVEHECLEWCPICRTADVVRAGTPPELREQWQGLQRDALVAVRALLDAYLARLEHAESRRPASVEDIPIQ